MPSKTTTLYSNGGNPYTLGSGFSEMGISTPNNYSILYLEANLIPISNYWSTSYPSTLGIYWHDNRENVDRLANSITFYGIEEGETKTVGATINVYHKEDGTLSGYAYAYFTKGSTTSSFAPNSGGVATDLTPLTNIDRYPLITGAPNFTDEENPTITYTTNVGFENARTYACISLDGTTDNIAYREVNINSGSYTFELTDTERNVLRNATPNSNTLSVTFILKTVVGSTNYYSSSTKQMTIINAKPSFTYTIQELNGKVSNLLGESSANKIVENASIVGISITPTAKKGANISKIILTHDGTAYTQTSSYDFTIYVKSASFEIQVIDSRNNKTTQTITKILIPYTPINLINFTMKRESPTSSNVILNLDANYQYRMTYREGSTTTTINNQASVKWKLDDGSFTTIPASSYTIDVTNKKLKITNYELTNVLPYTAQGQFTIHIGDLLTEAQDSGNNGIVIKGIPTYDAGEHDLQVNGDLFIADVNGENSVNVLDRIQAKILWQNSNPTTSISSDTTINLNSNDYDFYEVVYAHDTSNTTRMTSKSSKGYGTLLITLLGTVPYRRIVEYVSDTSLKIKAQEQSQNTLLIPLYIIGYKSEMF